MIKGKRKNLNPEENLDSILNANAGLPAWRQVIKRPRRRVTIAYHWNDDNWDWNSGLIVPDNEWIFVAVVVEPTQATMYMSDGITYSFATNIVDHDIEEFDGLTYVGWDYEQGSANRFFNGLIDDVRIYTRALELSEVMGLSGLTGMQYLPLETISNIVVKDPPGGPYTAGNPDIVNLRDYAAMADNWLAEILWP